MSGIVFGTSEDTNLYRTGATTLVSDDYWLDGGPAIKSDELEAFAQWAR